MVNSILAVVGAAVFVWLVTAIRERSQIGGTYPQAVLYTLYKFLFGIRLRNLPLAPELRGPVVFLVEAQSRFDRALLKTILPIATFHVDGSQFAGEGQQLVKSVLQGQGLVCLYLPPEGEASAETQALLTRIGSLARELTARIHPLAIRGTRHSVFSLWTPQQAPRSLLPQIVISASADFSVSSTSDDRMADDLIDGMALAKFNGASLNTSLFEAMVNAARLYGGSREILLDALGGKLSYRKMLIGARILAVQFEKRTKSGEAVGLLLPNSNAVVLSYFGLLSAARIPAMLNYTAGPAALLSALRAANIQLIICSRAFVEKAALGPLVTRLQDEAFQIHYIEDIRDAVRFTDKIKAFFAWRRPLQKSRADAPATVLFTSGSEGKPKGVVLSARNLLANAAQAECRIDISPTDTLFNVLPVFHSFGLLGGMLLPLLYGVRLYLYPSPLHYRIIPSVARKLAPTIMFGTDTFLQAYGRTAHEGDFASLRLIVAGAEAVRSETRRLYQDRFGAEIVEGYGMTEASPVVAVNSSAMHRPGSVGRPLPGITLRTEPVDGIANGARLLVSGPNIMLGYIRAEAPGVIEPIAGGWHDTGDIVSIDDDGYISILGRAKRFAKIAGEMVSLGAVEIMVQNLWPEANHAAIALPDRRKGERIVLVTTKRPALLEELRQYSHSFGATELMVPDNIVSVEEIPVLGSGKTDYVSTERIAAEKASL